MFGIRNRTLGGWLLAGGVLAAVVGACADKKGAVMLAINTDMRAPKDVNAVSVTISTNGAIKHSFIGRVTPQGEVLLPATLAIVEPEDANATIRIRVMAFQDRRPRVLRDIRTSVPRGGRTALLRIPLNFVNDGMVVGPPIPATVLPPPNEGTGGETPPGGTSSGGPNGGEDGSQFGTTAGDYDFMAAFQPPCPAPDGHIENQTVIDGECADNYVDPATLPDFDPGQIGDSTDVGSCFDLAKCFAGAVPIAQMNGAEPVDAGTSATGKDGGSGADVTPPDASVQQPSDAGPKPLPKDFRPADLMVDLATCSLDLAGSSPDRLNLALITPDTGECVRPGECYVPIDRGDGGWKEQNGRVQLPTFICKLINGKSLRLATSSDVCPAKEEKNPICTPKVGDPIVAAVTGPRRMIPADFASTVAGSNDGRLFVGGRSGFVMYSSAPEDERTSLDPQLLVAGDGTDAPRGFLFTTSNLDTYVVNEGSRVYVVRPGRPVQQLDFDAQVVGVGSDSLDFIIALAKRSGDSVFRVAQADVGAPPMRRPAFNNTTGKLVTALAGLQQIGFALGFDDGSTGLCQQTDAAQPCTMLNLQTFPGVGRVDSFVPLQTPTAETFAFAHHAKGLTRLDTTATLDFAATNVLTSDLSGYTNAGAYYPRGFIEGPPCFFYISANDDIHVRERASNADTVLAHAPAPALGLGGVQVGGPSGRLFLVWSVFAAQTEQGGIWGVPVPDACLVTVPGPVAPDGGADASTSTDSGPGADCSPQNCPNGCCSAQNICLDFAKGQQSNTTCGAAGAACSDCTPMGVTCIATPGGGLCGG